MGILSKAVQNISEIRWHPAKWPPGGDQKALERWLATGKWGEGSYTGKSIDAEKALSSTAVWSAVTQLSQGVASLPLHLYKRKERGKDRAVNHSLYRMLHLAPNPEMTSMNFREAMMGQILRYGFCVAEKEIDLQGNILGLWPLISRKVRMDRLLGIPVCVVSPPNGGPKILDQSRALKIVGFSQNGIMPYDPISIGRESIALSLAVEEYGARFYGNGARPDAVLEHPSSLSAEAQDRLRKSWNEIHQGLEKSHRIAILEEGMKLHEFTTNPQNAQAIETRKFQIEEVARIFNMPPHMLKDLSRSTNNNIEKQSLEFVIYTLRPWLVRFEQSYTMQLLSEKEQKKYFFEHLIDGLLRGDIRTRHASYTNGRQWGYYSANDIREMENKNSIGPDGDMYLVPMNMIPADLMGQELPFKESNPNLPPEGEGEDEEEEKLILEKHEQNQEKRDLLEENQKKQGITTKKALVGINRVVKSFYRVIEKTAQEIVNREAISVKKAAKKHLEGLEERGVSGFGTWMEGFYKEHETYISNKLNPVLRSYQEMISQQAGTILGSEMGAGNLEKFFDETVENYVRRHVRSSSGQLSKIMREVPKEDMLSAVNTRMDEWYEKRAGKIAADESVRLANASARETWTQQGVRRMIWQTFGKNCPFCDALEGRVVDIQKPFFDAGDVLYVGEGGKFDIYNPETGTYKEKGLRAEERKKVAALKIYGKKFHAPIHQGCDCRVVPEVGTARPGEVATIRPMAAIGRKLACISSPGIRMLSEFRAPPLSQSCIDYVRQDSGEWLLEGEKIDSSTQKRLDKMKIPPAWRNVVVAANSEAKIQAIGVDKAGRWQYRYNADHVTEAARKKFNRVKLFSRDMEKIRNEIDKGVKKKDPLSMLLRLEDKTAMRVGSLADTKAQKKAYGLTTLLNEHVEINKNKIIMRFTAKEGIRANYIIEDDILASWIKDRKIGLEAKAPLFPDVDGQKINKYLKEISGKNYTIKDFRTYHGTRIAKEYLDGIRDNVGLTKTAKKQIIKDASTEVSKFLKNTPAMAKNSYIDPMVWEIIGGL